MLLQHNPATEIATAIVKFLESTGEIDIFLILKESVAAGELLKIGMLNTVFDTHDKFYFTVLDDSMNVHLHSYYYGDKKFYSQLLATGRS